MKNYEAYSAGIFKVTAEELSKLKKKEFDLFFNEKHVAEYLEDRLFSSPGITNIQKFFIPNHLKRCATDGACLIAFEYKGTLYAKRHNNSQYLTV